MKNERSHKIQINKRKKKTNKLVFMITTPK